ncbi:MAG: phosphoribosylaminoimidazolesuccinocarboxamide synthase [Burkholderiaceae bacterium]
MPAQQNPPDTGAPASDDSALYQSSISSLELLGRGKVRENYAIDDQTMLIVTTDRISAFDVIMAEPVPGKGRVLNQMALFWFDKLKGIVPDHLTGIDPVTVVAEAERKQVIGRSMVVKRLKPLPIEAVVRGYLIGSGWKDYQATGAVCGIELPAGLQQAAQLPAPIFTPATKAEMGDHDENISFDQMSQIIGATLAEEIRTISLSLYNTAAEYARARGIIIADTKFEFGLDHNNKLVLMDEILTADSSRYWPVDSYQLGISPPSFDKQFLRDYLESLTDWPKTAPPPPLPATILAQTAEKYREALRLITGQRLPEQT